MRCHFLGIGGVGMAGLAVLLKRRGHAVSGCDLKDSPRLEWLRSEGVAVTAAGHDPAHLEGAELVVATPAVAADNPELRAAGSRLRYRGSVLAELVGDAADSIAVCGSHGKTTTATFLARLLLALGERVEWAIGGETGEFPVAGCRGPAERVPVLVVEADESDGTLAEYHAGLLVVTNCEYDHPDHFRSYEDYLACYQAARRQAHSVLAVAETLDAAAAPAEYAAVLAPLAAHNRLNALAAATVAERRGHPRGAIAAALSTVVAELPDRRFQRVWPPAGVAADRWVITDYAHHPTEIGCAVAMARSRCPGQLRVLFQPHRYSRTRALKAGFPAAFASADEVVLCPTYAAFESPLEGGSTADLYAECRSAGLKVMLARSCAEAWEHARNSMAAGDLTLLLGAGDIIALVPAVERGGVEPVTPRRRVWIGAGSNTWRSDLKLSVDYVKTAGSAGASGASLGIPWMAGIPGTIGGWVKMNAGAFGHSISEVVRRVKVSGRWWSREECGFGYRTSAIDGEIEEVEFAPFDFGGERAEDYLRRRRQFPAGTKGSVFRNPPGDYAGRLLEAVGAKGLRVGGAYVWLEHANVIVSGEGATASDFLALAQLMRERVRLRLGVELEYEVTGL